MQLICTKNHKICKMHLFVTSKNVKLTSFNLVHPVTILRGNIDLQCRGEWHLTLIVSVGQPGHTIQIVTGVEVTIGNYCFQDV